MAKRRKEKDEDEDKPFKIPKFDEQEFIKRERRNIKATFIAFLFGVLMAFVCFGFWALMGSDSDFRWYLVFLVFIANAAFIKYLFLRVNIDLTDFAKKNWFVTYAVYFFTWLIIFIVIVNPPIYDDELPLVNLAVLPESQEFGGDILFVAKITDNAGVEKSGITFLIDDKEIDSKEYTFENNYFKYTFSSPSNNSGDITYNYKLVVKDINGNKKRDPITGSFKYSNSTIRLASNDNAYSYPGPEVFSETPITFKADNVDILYYKVNDGPKINITYNEQGDNFITYPKYQGWKANENVTLTVYGEVFYNFKFVYPPINNPDFNITDYMFNNSIVDTQTYYFRVGKENIGLEEPPVVTGPPIKYIQVPGFEAIIVITALVIVVLIFRRKKKDEKN